MQNTTFFVAANETLGVVKDYANAKSITPPTLVRGVEACLKMRLFANRDGTERYPLSAFSRIVAWQWAMDNDFNEATNYKLTGDDADISIGSVTENIDGEEIEYTEVSIPMTRMNTEELAAWLGTEKSKSGLHGELVGFDSDGRQVFILQIENFTVRNRITSLGSPIEIQADYLTAAQVRALIASGMECEFSLTGEEWHSLQANEDRFFRFRLTGSSGDWSDPVGLVAGTKGDAGKDAYCYVAYASDSRGTNFSLTPTNGLKFRAEIHTDTSLGVSMPTITADDVIYERYPSGDMMFMDTVPIFAWKRNESIVYSEKSVPLIGDATASIENGVPVEGATISAYSAERPNLDDFAGVSWVKYCGDDGTGVGDMLKSVYDPDDDGKVNSADEADHAASADAVPWNGVSGKPTGFTPLAHKHTMGDISNPVCQKVYGESNPKTLYLDTPILRNTATNSSGTIELEFTAIKESVGGSVAAIPDGLLWTWEYHVPCGAEVSGVSVGSESCSMAGVNIPETLELINNNVTVHVFVIRALYKSGAVNNVRYQANYAYSYEA